MAENAYQQWKLANPNFFDEGYSTPSLFSREAAVAPAVGLNAPKAVLGSNAAGYTDTTGASQAGFATAPSTVDWGSMAGAGIGAAGQAASGIAQAATNKQILDNLVSGNAANRASSERMAQAQLTQNAQQFRTAQQMNAYNQMLAALATGSQSEAGKRALSRSISNSGADGLTTAYLG